MRIKLEEKKFDQLLMHLNVVWYCEENDCVEPII